MKNNLKPKILFFAYSTTVLKHYWDNLKDRADCWWFVWNPYVYEELKRMGCSQIIYKELTIKEFRPLILYKAYKWILLTLKLRTLDKKRIEQIKLQITSKIEPDIWICDTTNVLANIDVNAIKVQVFHSVPYKKYILMPKTLNYDLILLPSEYHKQEMIKRFQPKNTHNLEVVGWPRIDDYINKKYNEEDRENFLLSLGLNPELKTVTYAPTVNAFLNRGLFPETFGDYTAAFEMICKELKRLNVNFILKLHPWMFKVIRNKKIHKIADKYDVLLVHKKTKEYIDNQTDLYMWATDILISDVSGIITDYLVLDRPIIYLNPDTNGEINWEESDLPKTKRAGYVVENITSLLIAVKDSLINPGKFGNKRKLVVESIFYNMDGNTSKRAADTIIEYLTKDQSHDNL